MEPAARRMVREVALSAGPEGGAYAVTVDGAGIVWANEIRSDTVVRIDPKSNVQRPLWLPMYQSWPWAATTAGWAGCTRVECREPRCPN
ncbi:hypothetical protein [Thiobacillus denitrificans]|uniref:hypothetical protein n=1 Tax=Thiobacillus denitrificans TaxID=36861 RepID=UPI00138F304C|nr:hypothetical protein [Thiobacillus denitrificans]